MTSPALERFRSWVAADTPAAPLVLFRVAFAAVWLVYDVLDLTLSGTARIHDWSGTSDAGALPMIQIGLIACELLVLVGAPRSFTRKALLLAAAARALEWYTYLNLNDFAYYTVTALILAQSPATGGAVGFPEADARTARWPRDVLVWQAAWTYLATGLLKLNPSWLSGRHLYVRFEYLRFAFGWHFPALMNRCADSLPCDAWLAVGGVLGELTLGLLLFVYPRRRVVLPIACGIHVFAALATNVWFFGPSLIAQVAFLSRRAVDGRDTGARVDAS